MLNHMSLFTGIGGWELALQMADIQTRTILYVEIDKWCQKHIRRRVHDGILDDAPIWPDVRTLNGLSWNGVVDILTASFPCQPFSTAGSRKGDSDERNLWPETARVIGEVRPSLVLLENVLGLIQRNGDVEAYAYTVLAELAQMGYVGHAGVVSARDAGAPHKRDRVWFMAHASSLGLAQQEGEHQEVGRLEQPDIDGRVMADDRCAGRGEDTDRRHLQAWSQDPGLPVVNADIGRAQPNGEVCPGRNSPFPPGPGDTDKWARVLERYPDLAPATTKAESPLCDMVDGISQRVAMLKPLGNAIVPQSAAKFLRTHGKGS